MTSINEIDTELLIVAIKKNPCIWNYKLRDYRNKTIKNRAWAAVCEEIVGDFKDKSINEKNAIGVEVQNKWKTVRDGFTRHCRNLKKKSGSAASTAKKYTFYDQLLFLKDVTEDKGESSSNFDAPSQENPPPTLQSTRSPIEHARKRQRKGHGDGEAEEALIEKLTKKINAETDSSESLDEDKSFLLSLLGDLKKISADWKLDAKLEILQVIKQYKTLSMPLLSHDSLSSQDYVSNTLPSTSHSVNYMGYSSTALPARPESQGTTNESLSSQDSVANPIPDLFSN